MKQVLIVLALPFLIVLLTGVWVVIVLSVMLKSGSMERFCEKWGW